MKRSGNSAPGRLLGLMSEKRDSWLGRRVYGRDPFASSPVGRLFIQPSVRTGTGELQRLDDVIGNHFAVLGWGADPTFGLTARARAVAETLGVRFVLAKPDVQMAHTDDVPESVIAIGDPLNRLKDWFGARSQSVVLLRPDRFVAGVCAPQEVSDALIALAGKVALSDDPVRQATPLHAPKHHAPAVVMQQVAGA